MSPFQPSSLEQISACRDLVESVRQKARALREDGHRVHFVFDFDFVLGDGRSDDAFVMFDYDVGKYFAYEERLLTELPAPGPWLDLAQDGLAMDSFDIVTARSSFVTLRMTNFVVSHKLRPRWQLFLGHQPKNESYRIILQSFAAQTDTHVFMVDDSSKHVASFNVVADGMCLASRCHGIVAPQIRLYGPDEVKGQIAAVMGRQQTADTHTTIAEMFAAAQKRQSL